MSVSNINAMLSLAAPRSAMRETERVPPPQARPQAEEAKAADKPQKFEALTDKFRDQVRSQMARGEGPKPAPNEDLDAFMAREVTTRMMKFLEQAAGMVALTATGSPESGPVATMAQDVTATAAAPAPVLFDISV